MSITPAAIVEHYDYLTDRGRGGRGKFFAVCLFLNTFAQKSKIDGTMEQEMTYELAVERLEKLTNEMERGNVPIDLLATKLKEAQQLLAFCKDKLTKADSEVKKLLED